MNLVFLFLQFQSPALCLLLGAFNSLTFKNDYWKKMIIGKCVFNATFLIVFWLFFVVILLEKEMATHSTIPAWKNPMDGGVWQTTVHENTKSQTRLRDFTSLLFFSSFSFFTCSLMIFFSVTFVALSFWFLYTYRSSLICSYHVVLLLLFFLVFFLIYFY